MRDTCLSIWFLFIRYGPVRTSFFVDPAINPRLRAGNCPPGPDVGAAVREADAFWSKSQSTSYGGRFGRAGRFGPGGVSQLAVASGQGRQGQGDGARDFRRRPPEAQYRPQLDQLERGRLARGPNWLPTI